MRNHRIAVLGTFDLQNYGDLLFPLLTHHELSERLGSVEILPFSYHPKDEPDWPYRVFPIEEFPQRLDEIDGVVVGGGHIIRFDREVAPGYGPASSGIHHPTGLWLFPAFLAAASGRPVVWNAIGVSPDFRDWAADVLAAVLEASAYVTVRDSASRATVRTLAPGIEGTVVPDSAFGVRALLDDEEAEEDFRGWRRAQRVEGPYVVVQATDLLQPVAEDLRRELEALADTNVAVVELPIGPVLGDRTGSVTPDWSDVVRIDPWPDPLRLTQIVGHAEAAVGQSLHLGITALCHGVPIHRPRSWPGQKYEILTEFPGVYQFDEHGGEPRPSLTERIGRGEASPQVADQQERLARHWDRVAEALDRRPGSDSSARRLYGLSRSLIRSLNALANANDALELRAAEIRQQGELREEAEQSRERVEEELAHALTSVEERRASNAELRRCLEDLRRLTDEERGRLEEELRSQSERAAETASRLSRSEQERRKLQEILDAIRRSRSWRLSTLLRRIYSLIVPSRRGSRGP